MTAAPPSDPVEKANHAFLQRGIDRLGGEATAQNIRAWASQNLPQHEREVYNRRLSNPHESDAAADELTGRYLDAGGARSLGGYPSLDAFQAGAKAAMNNSTAAAIHLQRVALTENTVLSIPS